MSNDLCTPAQDKKRSRNFSSESSSEKPLAVRRRTQSQGGLPSTFNLDTLSDTNSEGSDCETMSTESNKTTSAPSAPGTQTSDLGELKTLILKLGDNQTSLRQSLEDKIGNLEKRLDQKLTKEFKELRDYVDIEIGAVNSQISKLEQRINQLENAASQKHTEPFPCDLTVIAINWRQDPDENLDLKVQNLIQNGLGLPFIKPRRVMRLNGRDGKPGIVKIELMTLEDKITVLKAKQELKDKPEYRRVYLRRSMPHTERLIQLNFKQILKEMPNGSKYRMTGSGRIVLKEDTTDQVQSSRSGLGYSADIGRGDRPLTYASASSGLASSAGQKA